MDNYPHKIMQLNGNKQEKGIGMSQVINLQLDAYCNLPLLQ
jgi:hypothetical protein